MQITDHHNRNGRVGLALAGGGPNGAIYEIGALRALDEALIGLELNDVPVTVGVSSGALVGALLANGLDTAHLCRGLVHPDPGEPAFEPGAFLMPAFGDFLKSGMRVPGLLGEALYDFAFGDERDGRGVRNLIGLVAERLSRALPVGVCDNRPLRRFLDEAFARPGRTNDFRRLKNELYVVATDLDSGEAIRFGEPGSDHISIAHAVQASTALPGLYSPVEVDGRFYVDGVLLKTVHASVALDRGAGLVLCVNPVVPVDTARAVAEGVMKRGRLIDRGMPTVMSQALRTLVHSRMTAGMKAYEGRYDGADILLFEPPRDDYAMFFRNAFSFAERKTVVEHAYKSTLLSLARRRREVRPILERHGITLDDALLDTAQLAPQTLDLWGNVKLREGEAERSGSFLGHQLTVALDRLEQELQAG
ncbi:patatin-like phospholipase family protein [soil metagenome]